MTALELDIAVQQGSFSLEASFGARGPTVLFGPSGAGKTTILRAIAGLQKPARGRIEIGGRVLFSSDREIDVPVHRRRIGYVFQDGRLFPHLRVRGNLLFGRWLRGRPGSLQDFDTVVALLGLDALLDRWPRSLSGGERQRAAIGRALLSDPDILLLDEPLAGLDDERKAEVLPYIERLCRTALLPLIYVTHSMTELLRIADDAIVVSQGRVVAAGAVDDVFPEAGLSLAQELDAPDTASLLRGEIRRHDDGEGLSVLATALGELRVARLSGPVGTPVRVYVPARDIVIATHKPSGISALNILPVRIESLSPVGAHGMLAILTRDGARLRADLTRASAGHLALTPGQEVYAIVKSVGIRGA